MVQQYFSIDVLQKYGVCIICGGIHGNGDYDRDVKNRVQAGWNRWRKVTGILCDRGGTSKVRSRV